MDATPAFESLAGTSDLATSTSSEELLRACNDQSAQSRNTWFTFLLLGTYLAVTAGSTSHKQLLLETPVAMPLLGVTLPTVAFFQIAPWLFVLTHFFMLVQLYLLSRTLHAFNAASPQPGLRTQLDSFPVTQLIAGVPTDWAANLFVKLSCWITLLLAPIVLLLEFQVQFMPYHDVGTTYIHRAAIMVDLIICWLLWPAIMRPSGELKSTWQHFLSSSKEVLGRVLRKMWRREPPPEAGLGRGSAPAGRTNATAAAIRALCRIAPIALILLLSIATIGFSFLLATIPGEAMEAWVARRVSDVESTTIRKQCGLSPENPLRIQPLQPLLCLGSLSVWFGARSTDNDAHLAANSLPAKWRVWWPTVVLFEGSTASDQDETKRLTQRFAKDAKLNIANKSQHPGNFFSRNLTVVASEQLQGQKAAADDRAITLGHRDLRFARLRGVDLQGIELTGADLTGADLTGANLRNANMINLVATSARFDHAVLSRAKLGSAWLQGTSFFFAELQDASFKSAHLQGASLLGVSAERSDFSYADLRAVTGAGATLTGATLQNADVSGSDLTASTLDSVGLSCLYLKAVNLRGSNVFGVSLDCGVDSKDAMLSVDLREVSFNPSGDTGEDTKSTSGESRRQKRHPVKQSDIAEARQSWKTFLKAQNPRTGPDPSELAKRLSEIACQGDAFAATGIVHRIWSNVDDEGVRKLVAKAMIAQDCKGATLVSRASRDHLLCLSQGVTDREPCEKAVQLVRDDGTDPASADLQEALKKSPSN